MPIVVPLVALDAFVIALWCIAVALAIALVMDKLAAILSGVPWAGGYLSSAVQRMAQVISNAVGTLEHGIDAMIGGAWHALARYTDHLFNQFIAHSALILHLAQIVGSSVYSVSGLRSFVRSVSYVAHAALVKVNVLTREFKGIEAGVKNLERGLARGIGHDLRITVAGLESEVTTLERHTIPRLRRGIKTAEGEVTQLENFIKAIPGTRYLDWVAGIVAGALGLASLSSFLCNEFKNVLGRGCSNLWGGLENLLSLFIDGIILTDLCQIIPETVTFFSLVEGEITGLVSQAADAVCAQRPSGWVVLDVPPTQRPPAQTFDPSTL